jgi:hypothetical protein
MRRFRTSPNTDDAPIVVAGAGQTSAFFRAAAKIIHGLGHAAIHNAADSVLLVHAEHETQCVGAGPPCPHAPDPA